MKLLSSFLLISSILCLSSTSFAGDVRGPRIDHTGVAANTTNTYRFAFQAQETAQILVVGDGDTDLDCDLLDEKGIVVAADQGPMDVCNLRVVPLWTGSFTLRIKNLGDVANVYTMRTN